MESRPTPTNPLAKHFRTPSIYIKLPSGGSFWKEESLLLPVNGEIPILPMTTKDEIVLKTPDALMNGQGVVNAIESCCPSIKNAWDMPGIDVDAVIIAIRIASYGSSMDFSSTCPHCSTSSDYAIDLTYVLAGTIAPDYGKVVEIDGLKIKLKPQNYHALTAANTVSFKEQQILRTLSAINEDNKEESQLIFEQHLSQLIDLNIGTLTGSTEFVELEDGSRVSNPDFISEFYKNCDAKIIKKIQAQLQEFNEVGKLKPVTVQCDECTKEFDVSIEFEWSSFFANGS